MSVVVEGQFSLDAAGYRPVRTPVGPFETYEDAEVWLAALGPRWGECSVVRLTSPKSPDLRTDHRGEAGDGRPTTNDPAPLGSTGEKL